MKKSAKLSLTLALMMGITGGVQMMQPNQASAEISDNFRLELNGVTSYYHDADGDGVYFAQTDKNGRRKENYWNSYTRVVLKYYADKNTQYVARLHSNYDDIGDFMENTNDTGAFFDQTYLQITDKPAKVTYTLGKKGAYMGQGMVYNSTGNLTGGQIQIGNWWDPTNVAFIYGDRKNGDKVFAVNGSLGVAKNVKLSTLYLNADHSNAYYYDLPSANTSRGYTTDSYGNRVYNAVYRNSARTGVDSYRRNHILSFGLNAKMPAVTLVGEYAHNLNGAVAKKSDDRRAWYVEAYTGPTTDMTSGLPLQKPGTSVWSLKYQDVGNRAVYSHNPTFVDDMKGFRLTYGHVFKKGLSGDIAIGRFKDKGIASHPMKNMMIAEIAYKFR